MINLAAQMIVMKLNLYSNVFSGLFTKKLSLFLLVFVFGFSSSQIISETFTAGSLPSGWSQSSVTFTTTGGGFANFTVSASTLTSPAFDASGFTSIEVAFDVAKFGTGGDGPITLEYSLNGGLAWTNAGVSGTPPNATYISAILPISSISSNMKVRFSRAGSASQKRFKNLVITGVGTACTSPVTQANTFSSSAITQTSATAVWTRGTGSSVLVLARAGSAVNADPVSGSAYNADAAFGSGDQIGTGNYVVYNGTGTSVDLTALAIATTYHFAVFEYNTIGVCYNTTELVGNFTTLSPPKLTISGTLNEATLNNANVALTLANDTFADATLLPSNFTLTNAPIGVTVSGITYNSPTSATLSLAYNDTDFDATVTTFNVNINNAELAVSATPLTSNNLTITAVVETLSSTGTVAFGNVCFGTSTDLNFTLTGTGLKAGNINLAALTGYYYSETSGGVFTPTLTFAQAGGNLSKVIYVRFTPPSANITYNGTIAISGGAASALNKAVSGNSTAVIGAVVTNTVTIFAATTATLRATSSTFSTCPATVEKGFVYAVNSVNSAPINGGTGVTTTQNGTLGSGGPFTQAITGLAEGTTYAYQAYLFDGTTYVYGGVQTFQTTVSSATNVTGTSACMQDDTAVVSWTASSNATAYLVFAVANATIGTGTLSTDINDYNNADPNYSSATNSVTPATRGKLLYNGTGTSVNVSGLTENTAYSFNIIAYKAGAELRNFANGTTIGSKFENALAQDDVKTFTGTPSNQQVTLNWTNYLPVSCFDEVLIVANLGPVVFTPSGDGSAYTANSIYNTPNQVVYQGTGTSRAITGLTNGLQYCFKIFVRRGTVWSDGLQICVIPDVVYCNSAGNMSFTTAVTNVQFNTINQTSGKTTPYSDYTAVSTTVALGSYYPLSVKANTDGNFTVYSKVWFDWNHDGTYTAAEEADLGTANNVSNGVTSNSPLTILIPHNAVVGNTRMRVSVKYDIYATPCENAFDGEVEDYTLNIMQPIAAEMNVKGGITNISIPNGFDDPNGLNNTLFGATPIITDSPEKTFTIENVGLADLNLSGSTKIDIVGANPTDFIVTLQSASPVISGSTATFKITFHPLAAGLRTATVSIANNDPDENPYTFAIEGTGTCTTIPVLTVFPISGPAKTIVDFTSATSNLTGATITYNDVLLPIISSSPTTLQVQVPANANDGIFVVQLQTGCKFTQDFDVFDTDLTSCEGSVSANASDLIIYEVYDENGGSGGSVTIFNGTGAAVNLSNYKIERAGNYGGSYLTYANLSGTLANGALSIIRVTGSSCTVPVTTGNGSFGSGFNANDGFRLKNGGTIIDDVKAPNNLGYYMKRKIAFLIPEVPFVLSHWTIQSISPDQCLPNIGVTPVVKTPPVLLTSPVYTPSCSEVTLSVSGQEGYAGGNALTFQWFALAPMSNNWISISDGPFYSGSTTANLTISDLVTTDGYQFYAQIRENTATCYIASNATKVELQKTTWAGSWSNGLPTVNSNIIIAGTYNTQINGSLDVCRLTVNSPGNLLIKNGFPIKVKNKITNNSSSDNFVIESGGNLIQEDVVTNSGAIKAERSIVDLDNDLAIKMDYVFWSSPVTPQNIQLFSPGTPANRLFEYKESTDRFIPTTDVNFMAGKGYAIRAESGNVTPTTYSKVYEFKGVPNNGNYSISLTRSLNEGTIEHGYNLIGNPYPSNLSFDELYNLNSTVIFNTAWFWTNTTFTASQLGSSYNGNNYAVYNGTGGNAATVPADVTYNAIIPDGTVAVGQGFLVQLQNVGVNQEVFFKNKNGANFLRIAGDADFYQKNNETKDRFWLKLIAPNNMQNTQLIGYVEGATDGYERDYDAKAISDTSSNLFYSVLDQEKLIIQGRGEFSVEDKIKLGANIFVGGNYTIGLYKSEGIFENSQHVYLKDYVLNIITDLSVNDYNFDSDAGDIEGRFEIIYKSESTLVTSDTTKDHLQIYRNGEQFTVKSNGGIIEEVEVYDVSGRLLQKVEGGRTELNVDATGFVNGIYVLKIKTINAVISKKIMK